jgi:hypothetical protein
MTRRLTLLWHNDRPVGICAFCAPAPALRLRSLFFGLGRAAGRVTPSPGSRVGLGLRRSLALQKLNQELWLLSRVVLHPTYRGAGVAAAFVRQSCLTCKVPWIETLSAMGHLNPFFEKAGFRRVGVIRKDGRGLSARQYGRMYGRKGRVSEETVRKSRYAEPVYYVFDNRRAFAPPAAAGPGPDTRADPA